MGSKRHHHKVPVTVKINDVQYELNGYGHQTKYEISKLNYCKKLNKAIRNFTVDIAIISQHIYNSIKDIQIQRRLNRKKK